MARNPAHHCVRNGTPSREEIRDIVLHAFQAHLTGLYLVMPQYA
jgi:hypothetical protein